MSKVSKLKNSRQKWKEKACSRGEEIRDLRKTLRKKEAKLDEAMAQLNASKKASKGENKPSNAPPVLSKSQVALMVSLLFIDAKIGYRAISRVLKVVGRFFPLHLMPSHQTVVNWLTKLSIVKMRNLPPFSNTMTGPLGTTNGYIYLIDESIGHSGSKILAILAMPIDHYKNGAGYPKLSQLSCIGVAVGESWTGENVRDFLAKVIKVSGKPVAYLKDQGSNLEKACRLLASQDLGSVGIKDISHYAANLLKKLYEDDPRLEQLLGACGESAKKLKQSLLGCLCPPKVRHKARFMNITRILKWVNCVLSLSPVGRAKRGSMLEKLRKATRDLPPLRKFVQTIERDAMALIEIQKILKNRGYSKESSIECERLLDSRKVSHSIRDGMLTILAKYKSTATSLGLIEIGMPVSSDGIESLFGWRKHLACGQSLDPVAIAHRIPLRCGELTEKLVMDSLQIPQREIEQQRRANSSMHSDRNKIFREEKSIEELASKPKSLQLIAGAKKREKDVLNADSKGVFANNNGPQKIAT